MKILLTLISFILLFSTQLTFAGKEGKAKAKSTDVDAAVVDLKKQSVVEIAVGSKDHTTLVAALKAADLVESVSNQGPFTVFAPVNAAFDALPKGTVETLLKPENKEQLKNILEYHVWVGVLNPSLLTEGSTWNEVNGDDVKVTLKNGKIMVNDATILASIKGSNGIIHVIDKVLLPPAKKQ